MSGISKRTTVEAEVGDINLGNIQIRDGTGAARLMDVNVDPTNPAVDSANVQDLTTHALLGPMPAGAALPSGGSLVPVAATALSALPTPAPVQALLKGVTIQASFNNAGPIALGLDNLVVPTPGAEVGIILQPGQTYALPAANTNTAFVRSTVATDRVMWIGG